MVICKFNQAWGKAQGGGGGGEGGRPKNDWNDQMNKTKQSLWSFDNEMFVNCLPGAA